MITATTTRTGARLYVGRSLAFLARDYYVNAWGRYNVLGTLFDLETGTIQRDALAYCNMQSSEAEIVSAVMTQHNQ